MTLELGVLYDVSIHVRAGVMEDWSDAEILMCRVRRRHEPWTPGRVYLLNGEPVVLLCRSIGPGPRNALFLRPDGSKTCRPFRGVRRLRLAATRPG